MTDIVLKIKESKDKSGNFYTVNPKNGFTIPAEKIVPVFKLTGKKLNEC